ncbi:MAG: YdcF family protein [Lachnospiraceae bacterium]|nr:YdcF family protein [Lachnospiraceae bacterium]
MNILFGVFAVLSLAYYIGLVIYVGMPASFSVFWLMAAICSGGLCLLFSMRRFRLFLKGLPMWVKIPVRTTVVLGFLCFFLVEGFILFHMFEKPKENLDYLVVLGAQVRGDTITKSLRYRLDTAIDYLEENPDTKVVVTGGKGPGENVSEAVAMRNYLVEHGIERHRIIMERYATNTEENLSYSKALIGDSGKSVGVVTNGFHVFRSVCLAEKTGMEHVVGIAAPSDGFTLPNMLVREFFAVLKDKFVGNI